MYYIYKIENLQNHKKYIGLTNNIARRRSRHFTDLRGNRHDNAFLQKELNIYGEENFSFEKIFEGDLTDAEIGEKEQYYIKYYDSYKNGYNQNEGGNFGASNGGTQLTQSDIFNILSALEFVSRPGQVLSDMYEVSRTTISRIKRGENHNQYKEEYDALPLEERKQIFKIFNESADFIRKKNNSSKLEAKRKFTKEQVFYILANFDYKITTKVNMAKFVGVKSTYTLDCIKKGFTYKDFSAEYQELTEEQKNNIATQLREQLK